MKGLRLGLAALTGLALLGSAGAWAGDVAPPCLSNNGQPIPIENAQALNWKVTTQNNFQSRAHVSGTIVQLYPQQNGHDHFGIQIGNAQSDTVEIVYNLDFGNLHKPSVGDTVEACGDFITANAPSGGYPASPDGALIHWVHSNNKIQNGVCTDSQGCHPNGFLVINGSLYGT